MQREVIRKKTARRGREDGVLSFGPSPYLPFFSLRSSLNSRHSSLFEHLHNRLLKIAFPIAHARAVTMDFAASTKSYSDIVFNLTNDWGFRLPLG